jgi:hypothetical protein
MTKRRPVETVGPKSLNIAVRKKENDRIERENHNFAKRLFDRVGSLSKKRMDEEYQNHIRFRKQLQKMKKKK